MKNKIVMLQRGLKTTFKVLDKISDYTELIENNHCHWHKLQIFQILKESFFLKKPQTRLRRESQKENLLLMFKVKRQLQKKYHRGQRITNLTKMNFCKDSV